MIAECFNAVVFVFKLFYLSCLWIGWANATILVGIVKGFLWICTNTALGISILCEDFLLFLEDVGETVELCVGGVAEAVATGVFGLWGLGTSIFSALIAVPIAVKNTIMSMKSGAYLVNFLVLVKDAVLLLGICFWHVFAWIYSVLVYLNEAPYILVLLLARAADNALSDLVTAVETYWFRSLTGLALGYGAYLLAISSGILPEPSLSTLICRVLRKCHSTAKCFPRMFVIGAAALLCLLQSAVLACFAFIARQINAVKVAVWELYREFVCYTPTKAALKIKLEKEKASSQCVVCMDRRRNVMIRSCRHLLMCKPCALTVAINSGECPVCRTQIDEIVSVYI